MFIVLLRFSTNKGEASRFMADHNAWIRRGFDEGVFLLAGGIKPGLGGAILAHGASLADLQERIANDPFVAHDVVAAEIIEVAPAKADDRLGFLLAQGGSGLN
jgi:uncharacterized protein YciI